jgi:hypothetical protein
MKFLIDVLWLSLPLIPGGEGSISFSNLSAVSFAGRMLGIGDSSTLMFCTFVAIG